MTLLDAILQISTQNQSSMQPTDLETGTVTSEFPLEITKDVHQQALKQEVLYLTESVIEKRYQFSTITITP